MAGYESERFKMIRRNSLRHEVDGSFEELEEFEDRNEGENEVTHQECMLLNRVLSDKGKLPEACRAPSARAVQNVSEQSTPAKAKPDESSGFEGIVRRLTGAIPGAFTSVSDADDCKKEFGGVVTADQCQTLADYLTPSVGGLYLMPGACSTLLATDESDLAKRYEKENAEVYERLKRRKSVISKAGYPPTMC